MADMIIVIIILVLIIVGSRATKKHLKGQGGCCGGGSKPAPKQNKKLKNTIAKKVAIVEGMTCEHCKNWVEKSINDKCIQVKDTTQCLFLIGLYIRKQYDIPLIGITGSNGKTTTKDLLYHVLSSKYKVLKNDGSKNNIIGVSDTLFKLNKNHEIIVMELGTNHLGEISYLSKMCEPDVGIITNIGSSHLEYFKTRKNIFKEKISILDGMKDGNLIVNGDDKYLKRLCSFKCGLNKNNDLPSNHDILKIFTNDKDYLIGIGLKLDYYEYCEKQLKQIGEYAATNDFSMCFRFPFDKNYQSKIITKKMMNIKFSDIERIVNEQKYLFMIFEFMIVLSEKEFYKKVYMI